MNTTCYPPNGLISLQDALDQLQIHLRPVLDQEQIELSVALGRILSQPLVSPINIPPQRVSAMDGYAYDSRQLALDPNQPLSVIGQAWAGKPFMAPLGPNQCIRIMTGAVVPEQADSVIAQEMLADRSSNQIRLPEDCAHGKNIRAAGSDTPKHSLLLSAPHKLRAFELGLLASAGISSVPVKRRLRIGHFSTGDELCPLNQPLQSGQIYDSNRYLLQGLLNDPNYDVTDLGTIRDDLADIKSTLEQAGNRFDVVISSGGVSVGDADLVKTALQELGEISFWKLAIKPGKPLAFGRIGNSWFFGLPGNPVAVVATFMQLVEPALQYLSGLTWPNRIRLNAISDDPIRKVAGRQEFQRGILRLTDSGDYRVALAEGQDSHQLRSVCQANCFILLSSETTDLPAGTSVTVEPFSIFL